MPTQELSGTTALVTGTSRGFGSAIAVALSKHGAHAAGVARDPGRLEELRAQLGDTFTPVAADAADPVVAGQLLDKHRPRTLVPNARAAPLPRPIHRQTWQPSAAAVGAAEHSVRYGPIASPPGRASRAERRRCARP
jgi:NADP-dependent 3-hydroxy acid dehydrogenase YdfG